MSSSSSSLAVSTTSANCVAAYGQCGGQGWTSCCQNGYTCQYSNDYYSQCVPGTSSSSNTPQTSTTSSTTSTTSSTTTSTSSVKQSTSSSTLTSSSASSQATCAAGSCNSQSGTSNSCAVPYSVSVGGVTLPSGTTFPSGGHVNYQYISCANYKSSCGRYTAQGSGWTDYSAGTDFDPNLASKKYIGASYYDFSDAVSQFGSNGYCVIWVQVSMYNEHFGEGGQMPYCKC